MPEAAQQLTAPGQMFEVSTELVDGLPTKVWKNCPPSLRSILELSRLHGDKTFLVYEDDRLTFEEHFVEAAAFAHALVERYGVSVGDRVSIAMRNFPEWVVAFWGAAAVGAVIVPLNAWWTAPRARLRVARLGLEGSHRRPGAARAASSRISDELRDSGLGNVVVARVDDDAGGLAPPAPLSVELAGQVDRMEDVIGEFRQAGGATSLPVVEVTPDDNATIFYTSGTTGKPKGALGTQRNICTNLMSLGYVNARGQLTSSVEQRDELEHQPAERVSSVGPAVPRDRVPLDPRRQHGGRRQARDDAPLEPRASARADRTGADHDIRRRPDYGVAGHRVTRVRDT